MRILIVSVSNLRTDPRVHRQIAHLSRIHDVTCVGLADPEVPGVAFVRIPDNPLPIRALNAASMAFHRYDRLSRRNPSLQLLRDDFINREFDLNIANDTNTLSFACAVRGPARILFDAHEYAPREFEDSWRWRYLHQGYQYFLCRQYLPQCDGVITVCDGIAEEFQREFGRRPTVITNASDYRELSPFPVDPKRVRLIHHLLMWAIIAFVIHHVYSAALVDHYERTGLMSSIFAGSKFVSREEIQEARDGGWDVQGVAE
jgi:hypothetical protein